MTERIKLKNLDAGIIFHVDGSITAYLPKQGDTELLPPHVLMAARCLALTEDPRAKPLLEQLDHLMKAH